MGNPARHESDGETKAYSAEQFRSEHVIGLAFYCTLIAPGIGPRTIAGSRAPMHPEFARVPAAIGAPKLKCHGPLTAGVN